MPVTAGPRPAEQFSPLLAAVSVSTASAVALARRAPPAGAEPRAGRRADPDRRDLLPHRAVLLLPERTEEPPAR
jgi:hypothetical protein